MFINMLTALLTSSALLTAALPIPQAMFPQPAPDTKWFTLKMQTLPGTTHPEFDGQYLNAYHTGAGFNDVTFGESSNAPRGFLNGTQAQWNVSNAESYAPWAMVMVDEPYSNFSPVEINAGYGDNFGAFYFNQTAGGSLWWNALGNATDPYYKAENNEFNGWLACNWVHSDLPQLFWQETFYQSGNPPPSNCAPIYLIPEYSS